MPRYAVAVCNTDEDNEVRIVEADNELKAMVLAVGMEESWGIKNGEIPFQTVDEGITFYIQGDTAVSIPVEI